VRVPIYVCLQLPWAFKGTLKIDTLQVVVANYFVKMDVLPNRG